jgi:hypothetical protein
MNFWLLFLISIVALLPKHLFGVIVSLENDQSTPIEPNSIVRVDLSLKNEVNYAVDIFSKIEADSFFDVMMKKPSISLDPKEKKQLSFFFKIDPKITAGKHTVTFKFNDSGKTSEVKKVFFVEAKTKVYLSKVIYDDTSVVLQATNKSNHPVNLAGFEIPAYSDKTIPYKFSNKTANNFYTDKIPVYYDNKKVSELTIFCKTSSTIFIPKNDEEFLFPINYGFAFSNNKSHKSLTIYTKGGGQFSRNQELEFSFSAPFYGGGLDPYLFYDPEAALFYVRYRYKTLSMRAGDSYFQNNPYLFYRYGRGYVAEYNNLENFKTQLGYITENQFYKSPKKDLILTIEKTDNPRVYYNSFSDFHHYNQNLGLTWEQGTAKQGAKANIELFNTDFCLNNDHSGALGAFSYQSDYFSTSLLADYIGNQFRGRTNSESRAVGSIRSKIPALGLSSSLKGSYSVLFPYEDPEVRTKNFGASLSKKIGKSSNSLTFDYLDYDQEDLERKNYSFYYSFSRSFGHDYFLSLDQGLTYSDIEENSHDETFKTYTRINGSFHKDRWSLNLGILSQVRFFSESTRQQNSLFFGTTYRYKQSKAFINFTFSNSTFSYKPSINLNYSTKFKMIDLELDYNLIPSMQGYDWRAMVKFNVLQYLHFKKPSDTTIVVYDKNTKKPISNMLLKNGKDKIQVENGSLIGNFSDNDLKSMTFSSLDVERKFSKKVHKDFIDKEFIFNLDYRAKVYGQLDFRPRYGLRDSINKLILKQRAYARSEDGKYYYGLIDSEGSFSIPGLPVGRYKVGVNLSKLPASVNIPEKLIVVDYTSQDVNVELIVSY